VEGLEVGQFRTCSLDLALEIAADLVDVAASLHVIVASQRSDVLLDLSLDLVANTLGVGLGIGGLLGGIGLSLLMGSVGGKVAVAEGLTDGLLGAADIGVCGVLDSVGHVVMCVELGVIWVELVVVVFVVDGEEKKYCQLLSLLFILRRSVSVIQGNP